MILASTLLNRAGLRATSAAPTPTSYRPQDMCSTPSPRERVTAALALQDAPKTTVLRSAAQPRAAKVADQHHKAQCAARATAQRKAHYAANPDYDPALLKPVRLVAPPQGLHPAERAAMESELGCLRREAAATARGIDHLEKQLAA